MKHNLVGPRAIIDNRYKLIIHDESDQKQVMELFDLNSDPTEENDLIEKHPSIAQELERKLLNWQESVLRSLMENDY